MLQAIMDGIASVTAGFGEILGNAFESVASLFVVTGEGGAFSLTLVGTVLVIAIGATVITFGIRLVMRLLNRIRVS